MASELGKSTPSPLHGLGDLWYPKLYTNRPLRGGVWLQMLLLGLLLLLLLLLLPSSSFFFLLVIIIPSFLSYFFFFFLFFLLFFVLLRTSSYFFFLFRLTYSYLLLLLLTSSYFLFLLISSYFFFLLLLTSSYFEEGPLRKNTDATPVCCVHKKRRTLADTERVDGCKNVGQHRRIEEGAHEKNSFQVNCHTSMITGVTIHLIIAGLDSPRCVLGVK